LLIREARRREAKVARPRAAPTPTGALADAPADRVPAHIRREVWARDQGRCQWPLDSGGVCGSTHLPELDHVRSRARGGPTTAANLRTLCRAHNLEAARRTFGAAWMSRGEGLFAEWFQALQPAALTPDLRFEWSDYRSRDCGQAWYVECAPEEDLNPIFAMKVEAATEVLSAGSPEVLSTRDFLLVLARGGFSTTRCAMDGCVSFALLGRAV
jgi:hypothetical protein